MWWNPQRVNWFILGGSEYLRTCFIAAIERSRTRQCTKECCEMSSRQKSDHLWRGNISPVSTNDKMEYFYIVCCTMSADGLFSFFLTLMNFESTWIWVRGLRLTQADRHVVHSAEGVNPTYEMRPMRLWSIARGEYQRKNRKRHEGICIQRKASISCFVQSLFAR